MIAVPGDLTVRQFFGEYYAPRRLVDASEATLRNWRNLFSALDRWRGGMLVRELEEDTIEDFLAWLAQHGHARSTADNPRGLAPATRNLHLRNLCTLWRLAWRRRIREELGRDAPAYSIDPDWLKWDAKARVMKRAPIAWTREDLGALFSAMESTPGTLHGVPAGEWWRALGGVLLYTGWRISSVMLLPRNALVGSCRLRVPAEITKERAEGCRLVDKRTGSILEKLNYDERGERRGRLFAWPYDAAGAPWKTLRNHFDRITERAGLDRRNADKTFHRFRITHGTLVAIAGGDASLSLNHSNPRYTSRYLDLPRVRQPSAVDLIGEI